MVKYNHEVAAVFSALSHQTRFDIMKRLLEKGSLPAGSIASPYQMSLPAISKHLHVLTEANLVHVQKAGKQRLYTPKRKTLSTFKHFIENSGLFWEEAFGRMAAHVEKNSYKS